MEVFFIPLYYRNTLSSEMLTHSAVLLSIARRRAKREKEEKGVILNVSWETREKFISVREKSFKNSLT